MSIFVKNTNYHTLEGIEREAGSLVEKSKLPAEIVTLGRSTEDRPVLGVCFGDGDHRKPEVLFLAGVHAVEFIGMEAALEVIRLLALDLAGDDVRAALEKMNVWVIPVLNPDGMARVENMLSSGLGLALARRNAAGVDLNRNFPVAFYDPPRSLFAGSPLRISPYYRGPSPCSEAESQALRDFIFGRNIRTSINFHSFGGMILYPYHFTRKPCRDVDTLARMAKELASKQERPYAVKPGWQLYYANGEIDDWLYDECNILPFCIEIGKLGVTPNKPETWINPFFWSNPHDPRTELENVTPAALRLITLTFEMFTAPERASC